MTKLYFIRHGESVSNRLTQFAGSLDTPLTDRGLDQARATAGFLKDVSFSVVYASDLKRAYSTGLTVSNCQHIPIVSTPMLREIYAGEWEGKTYQQLEETYADDYTVWKTRIGLAQCPGGESVAKLQHRVRSCVEEIVRNHPNETICIATHATPIRVLECLWTNTSLELMHTIPWVSNASVTIVEYDQKGRGTLIERDLHNHLGDLWTVLAKNV